MNQIKFETEWIIRNILSDIKKLSDKLNKQNREKVYHIQKNILFFIIDAEYRIEGFKNSIDSIKKYTGQFKTVEKRLKKDIPFDFFYAVSYAIDDDIKQLKDRINILKSLMDSILWKFCTNTELKELSFNQKESPIIGKTGLLYEMSALEHLYEKHKKDRMIFILNDLTNCIKISDITAIGEYGIKQLIECKMSPRGTKRTKRQFDRLTKFKKFIEKREIEVDDRELFDSLHEAIGDTPKNITSSKVQIKKFKKTEHEFSLMEKTINEAKKKGSSVLKVNDCITFSSIDLTKNRAPLFSLKQRKEFDKLKKRRLTPEKINLMVNKGFLPKNMKIENSQPKEKGSIFIFDICQYDSYLGYRRYYYLPFASFDISEDIIADLLLDNVLFLVLVNIDNLIKRIESIGFKAKFIDKIPQFLLLESSKGEKFALIDLFFKFGHEVIKLDYFLDMVKNIRNIKHVK